MPPSPQGSLDDNVQDAESQSACYNDTVIEIILWSQG